MLFPSDIPNRLIRVDQIRKNRVNYAQLNGAPYVIIQLDGALRVFSAVCPHALGDLSYGSVVDGQIDCPSHGWRFSLQDGLCQWPSDTNQRLKFLETTVVEGWLCLA